MATKVFNTQIAEALITGTTTVACTKCGESNWTKAQYSLQTKKPGMLTVLCKTCNSKAASACHKERYANDEAWREARKTYNNAYNKERRATDEAYREAHNAYHKERRATDEAYREAHNARSKACHKERYANDSEFREAQKAYCLQWAKDNPGKANAKNAKRRASKLQATPKWADLSAIQAFYENCPEGMHVDHIVPLQGELVSGLHVLENLQYLTASENLSKSNSFNL